MDTTARTRTEVTHAHALKVICTLQHAAMEISAGRFDARFKCIVGGKEAQCGIDEHACPFGSRCMYRR